MKKWILSLLFLTSLLEAKLEDHFRKCPGKGTNHTIRNIDFIYLINLDERPEKLETSLAQLEPFGIHPYRFSAVNGWKLSLDVINDVGVKFSPEMQGGYWATSYLPQGNFEPHHEVMYLYGRTYFCHCLARGTIGIALSHLSILQDAYDSGYETVWIMEDDIDVLRNPHVLSELVEKLDRKVGKEGWDVLWTDQDIRDNEGNYKPTWGHAWRPNFRPKNENQYMEKTYLDWDFRKIGARWGTTSMVFRRSGIEKVLNFIKQHQIYLPYDLDMILPDGIRLYTLVNDVVTNMAHAASDNGGPNYGPKK